MVLLTGDLIDYGRGHVGASFGGMYRNALGRNDAYHYDRNWFLFYYLLASGENYTKPAYTILGNHDWRLNPYPPFAPGAPEPEFLFHDAKDYNHQDYWKDVIKVAHGPGHERKFAYTIGAEFNCGRRPVGPHPSGESRDGGRQGFQGRNPRRSRPPWSRSPGI